MHIGNKIVIYFSTRKYIDIFKIPFVKSLSFDRKNKVSTIYIQFRRNETVDTFQLKILYDFIWQKFFCYRSIILQLHFPVVWIHHSQVSCLLHSQGQTLLVFVLPHLCHAFFRFVTDFSYESLGLEEGLELSSEPPAKKRKTAKYTTEMAILNKFLVPKNHCFY